MNMNRVFITNIDNKIYLLRKNIYDYSTFNPDTNIINDVAYRTIKQFTNITHFTGNIFTSSTIVDESFQYLHNDSYYHFKSINLVERNNNKQHVVIELLNPEFFINGEKIEVVYYHLINQQNSIQKYVIARYKTNISNVISHKIVRVILNTPIVNYIEIVYTDKNNNTRRYISIPEIVYTNNTHYIKQLVGDFNNVFLEENPNVIIKENSEKTYIHTLILSELGFIGRTFFDNTTNQVREDKTKLFGLSSVVYTNTLTENELFYIATTIRDDTNNTVREQYLMFNIYGIPYTSTIIVNEIALS